MVNNTSQTKQRKSIKDLLIDYGLYVVFSILLVYFAVQNPAFISVQNLITIVQMASTLGIVVVGMFFVLITGGIDISVASNMYFSAVVSSVVLNTYQVPMVVCFIIAILCGSLIGAINGFVIARFKMVPFITTLATMSIARGLGLLFSDQKLIVLDEAANVVSDTQILGIPLVVYIFTATLLIGHFILTRLQFGRQLFACGNNLAGAAKIGIKTTRTVFLAYLICGATAGLAGIMNATRLASVNQNFAIGDEFVVISSAVVGGASLFGGKGKIIPGAFIGIVMIQMILNGLTVTQASPYVYQVVRGVIIFIAVMVDSIKFSGEIR